jgi:O-acetyl-ADP-ribose deacetylase (regulator of RNase III)
MKIILTALEESLAKAWETFCGDLDFIKIHRGSIFDVNCEAVVSPANSFGFMDGGIDALYMSYFGRDIQQTVQQKITKKHHGELLVGAADIVETGDERIPYLIIAPTMRVPMILRDTVNIYLAARAVFLLLSETPIISTVAFPGLGTGVGGVTPAICAHQMRVAIDDILLGIYTPPSTWAEASERHQLLYTDKLKRLQHE